MNGDKIAGYFALVSLIIVLIDFFLGIISAILDFGISIGGGSPLISIAFIIAYAHVYNKTIQKKKKLTNLEWVLFSAIATFHYFFLVLGFIIGFTTGFSGLYAEPVEYLVVPNIPEVTITPINP